MRLLSINFGLLMLLFAAVQYNDPDALFWGVIYGAAAAWCGIAAFRPHLITGKVRLFLFACLALSIAGVVWFWPKTPSFWRQEIWWATETAREGMGMMVTLVALVVAWITSSFRGQHQA